MGNSNTLTKFNKKVVVVGGSFAGMTIAESLWDYFEVTLVDMKDFFEFNPANLRCAVDDQWIDNICLPYSDIVNGHPGKFNFVQGKLTKVNKENTIELTRADGSLQTLDYDFLVLATGFFYDQPVKDEKSLTIHERKATSAAFT